VNAPSSKQIDAWKTMYEIYKVVINKKIYIYRVLSIGESQDIQKYNDDPVKVENFVLNNCILYPVDFAAENEIIGVCNSLAEYVLKSTKIFEPDGFKELLLRSKNAVKDLQRDDFFIWSTHIIKNFPGYTFKSLKKLSPFDFFKLVYLCEEMSGIRLIGTPKKSSKNNKTGSVKSSKTIPNKYVHDKKVKRLSNDELSNISIEESTIALQNEWRKIKNNRG